MTEGRRILVTGISGALAVALASRLETDPRVAYVAGLDLDEPGAPLERTDFVRADLRSPLVAKVIESTGVDTLVHLAVATTPGAAGGRASMKELNVIGSMQLLAAARKAPRLQRVVVRSTTAVYGSHYANPALLREDASAETPPRGGYAKDATDIESYARALGRRRPDVALSVLRFASTVGPTVQTPLTHYFRLPVLPTVLGYDPRVQLVHEEDAVDVLARAALDGPPGVYNVAGPGIVYLSQAVRLAGRPNLPIPRPMMPVLAGMLRSRGLVDFSADQLRFLLYGRVADITRLERDFGFVPRYSTRRALMRFFDERGIDPVIDPAAIECLERRLLASLGRRDPGSGQP